MICQNCNGTGKVDYIHQVRKVIVVEKIDCPYCGGKGQIKEQTQTKESTQTQTEKNE